MELEVTGDSDVWPVFAAGLISRATTTLRSLVDLGPGSQGLDAATLSRSLYEHVVHLAWLGAEPSPARMERWRKDDLVKRAKADDHARKLGHAFMTNAARASLDEQIASMAGGKLVLADMAAEADRHWGGRLPEFARPADMGSFWGQYAVFYRQYSATAHPSYMGLNQVVEDVDASRKRVIVEDRSRGVSGSLGYGTVIYGLGLAVMSECLGWPDLAAVRHVFARYP